MKAVVFTLGCKVNECESHSLAQGLIQKGYSVTNKLVKADLYVVNTCAVTSEAEKKSRQVCSRINKSNPNAKVIFTGCACQKNPQAFLDKDPSYLVTGVFDKGEILNSLDKRGVLIAPQNQTYEELLPSAPLGTRAFIKVQDGCDNFCTYCIIPHLRGRSRSRNPESVKKEIARLNPTEAVITGINLTSYNFNGKGLTTLIDGLKGLNCRIRLGSLEACVITDEFLTALKGLKDFAPHFHLSLQSGSNAVLKRMNRRYTREEFLQKVDLIRSYFPSAGITTDIIAGFPTESEEDFLDTLDLIDKVGFTDIHPFAFSPREGTPAYNLPDIAPEVKKQRLNKLLEKKAILKERFALSQMGKVLKFIPEEVKDGYTQGYSQNYLHLFVQGDFTINGMVSVRVIKPFRDGALAEII